MKVKTACDPNLSDQPRNGKIKDFLNDRVCSSSSLQLTDDRFVSLRHWTLYSMRERMCVRVIGEEMSRTRVRDGFFCATHALLRCVKLAERM